MLIHKPEVMQLIKRDMLKAFASHKVITNRLSLE